MVNATPMGCRSAGDPTLDDEGDATDPEQKACRFSPCHPLVQEDRGEHGRQHRIGADDQRGQTGRDAAHAHIVEPEVERIIGDAEQREHENVATGDMPWRTVHGRGGEHQPTGEQETRDEQEEWRAVRQRKLRHRKSRTPEQAERRDQEWQGVHGATAGSGSGDVHEALSGLLTDLRSPPCHLEIKS